MEGFLERKGGCRSPSQRMSESCEIAQRGEEDSRKRKGKRSTGGGGSEKKAFRQERADGREPPREIWF